MPYRKNFKRGITLRVSLMKKHITYPSQQGSLDGLCGIYSLVNAMAYLYDGRLNRRRLKLALLKTYQSRGDLLDLISEGMDLKEMDYLIKQTFMQGFYHKHFPVKITKPFEGKSGHRAKKIMIEIDSFVNGSTYQNYRLVLIVNQYHWSLIKEVNEHFLYFFDSAGMKKSYRSSYSLVLGRTAYELIPDAIYFIERSFEDPCDATI